ncbi:transcriptional adapter 2b-like [Rhynchophorus ferrugineus]|uniref:Transcriptional adapter n=1 Tax=Rhynchophorus ferrugineus TaxID=354439 RepID=A0A834I6H7_RHYFE|nr:hypothetical protein GWI33_013724 [Rhynchophorus ferrugineus]
MADYSDNFSNISCVYCQEEINNVRVQCCECPNFDICLQCFALGAEIGPHKNNHAYNLIKDPSAVSLFGGRGYWTGVEHLRLLNAAELYSYGNWELIAEHVKTRTADECKEEYMSRYLNGNIGKVTWNNLSKPTLYMDLIDGEDALTTLYFGRLGPIDITPEEAKMLGYRPHRDEFEGEYNPQAELLISDLQSGGPEETGIEKALKLAIVEMYIKKLRERQRRKGIVCDYQLVSKYFEKLHRNSPETYARKGERELRHRLRPFSQFLSFENKECLIDSMYRERELRNRLLKLKRYRSIGLLTKDEMLYYEQYMAMYKQMMRQKRMNNGDLVNVSPGSSPSYENGIFETSSSSIEERTGWPFKNDSGYESGASSGQSLSAGASTSIVPWRPPETNGDGTVDVCDLPLARMLSLGEIDLCICLNLQPIAYVTLKSLLIRDSEESPGKYKYIAKKEPNSKVVDVKEEVIRFLHECGMLAKSSSD